MKTNTLIIVGLLLLMTNIPTVWAATGDILTQFTVPGIAEGNGRGMAFDGTNLYYTLVNDTNIYKITTGGTLLATIPVSQGQGTIRGGPLAWDGNALWTMNYDTNSFTLFRVDPISGTILSSCNIATQNPSDPAVTSSPRNIGDYPDGLDWTGSTLWASSEIYPGNWVVEVDTTCNILKEFNPPTTFNPGFGTSGIAFDGVNLWHATLDNSTTNLTPIIRIFQTDTTGTLTGISFKKNMSVIEDLAYDKITFSPKCALWGNSVGVPDASNAADFNKITAFEIPCEGSISGTKFDDLNGNGIHNTGEPGLANWTISLTNDSGSVVTTITDSNGNYSFTDVPDGNYTIGEIIQPGWIQTAPSVSTTGSATYKVKISGGGAITGKDFGNFQLGIVSGTKFEDLNANDVRDPNELGLTGWDITINGTDTITGNTVTQTKTTDANGNYNFTGLTAGTYVISETLKIGWIQTTPTKGNYTVVITSGTNISGQDFGNFHKGKITGGGSIDIAGRRATFGIIGHYPDSSNTAQGDIEYQDHIANLNIKSIQINTVATTLDKKKGVITGLAQVNGIGSYPFVVYVEDNAEPGVGTDVFNISLPTYPYSNGAVLSGGNIQIHS